MLKNLLIYRHPKEPQGLQVRFSGQAERLEIELDPDFPVDKIQPSLLEGRLPPDTITALLSLCAAMTGYLVPWLGDKLFK